jgi:DNA-directed RNA polymerase specialized sigma24 family protein
VDDSFERFVTAEMDGLVRYAVMLAGERELARDLVQDVLLKASQQWDRIGQPDRPRAYIPTMITRAFAPTDSGRGAGAASATGRWATEISRSRR